MLGFDVRQILLPDVEPCQEWQRDRVPCFVLDEQPEDDRDVPVNVRRTGWARGWVVVNAGSLDMRPVPLRGSVVQREGQPLGFSDEWLDCRQEESRGDFVSLLAGRRHGRITRPKLMAQPSRADPTSDPSIFD